MKGKISPHSIPRARIAHRITLGLYTLFMSYMLVIQLGHGAASLLRIAISCTPLLLVLPGLIKRHYRSGSWLCFLLLFYFMVWVANWNTTGNLLRETLAMILLWLLFTSAMMYSHWQQRASYLQQSGNDTQPTAP